MYICIYVYMYIFICMYVYNIYVYMYSSPCFGCPHPSTWFLHQWFYTETRCINEYAPWPSNLRITMILKSWATITITEKTHWFAIFMPTDLLTPQAFVASLVSWLLPGSITDPLDILKNWILRDTEHGVSPIQVSYCCSWEDTLSMFGSLARWNWKFQHLHFQWTAKNSFSV